MFDPVLLGIAPSIPSCKNLCHCRGIMPSAVPSLALLVRTPIPITRNAGMSARVMEVSFRLSFVRANVVGRSYAPLVVRRWSLAKGFQVLLGVLRASLAIFATKGFERS